MAITDKSNSEDVTPEAITGMGQSVAGPAQSAASNLPAALEPELRRIIDTAVARVAAIELDAIREARELTQRSEHEAREALRFALDRAFNLINSLELLASTVNGMAEALKVELDDAITALRNVPEPESELARELAAAEQAPAPVAQEPAVAPPAPEPETEVAPPPRPSPRRSSPRPSQPVAAAPEPRTRGAGRRRAGARAAGRAAHQADPDRASGAEVPEAVQQPAEPVPAAPEPEPELVTVGAPAQTAAPAQPAKHKSQPPHSRKGRVRRFFTR